MGQRSFVSVEIEFDSVFYVLLFEAESLEPWSASQRLIPVIFEFLQTDVVLGSFGP